MLRRGTEVEQPGLGSGIRIDAQRGVVFPTDVQAPRPLHDTYGAVGPTGVAARFVLGRIP